MTNYRIADAHAHIFPQKIAEKATQSIGAFYDIPMDCPGFPHSLTESGDVIGVERYLVCSTATTPAQVQSINNFIHDKCRKYPAFLGFATLHPDMEDVEGEVARVKELGLRGIKLHPDFQRFDIDSEKGIALYRIAARYGLPILFHTGDARYDYSAPRRLRTALEKAPGLLAIAAHFGGYQRWEEAEEYLKCDRVWFDTSSSLFALPQEKALHLLGHFGTDRFFWGTDFPMWNHKEELERFLLLGLPGEVNQQILYDNFAAFFSLEGS